MMRPDGFLSYAVKLLTLSCAVFLTSCSLVQRHVTDPCKSRAYVRTVMPDYLSTRYHTNAPVRLAVIPFSVAANLAGSNNENPGLGNELAWLSHAHLIDSTLFPIVEVFNRQDWPGKKEEFFTGNFGAITAARDAGYDLVLVGRLDPITSLDSLSATTKLIETESGMTLWFGTTKVHSAARDINRELSSWWFSTRTPSVIDTNDMKKDLARCIVREIISEKNH